MLPDYCFFSFHIDIPSKSKQGSENIFTQWHPYLLKSAKKQPVRERIKVLDWFAQISHYLRKFSMIFEKIFCDTYFLLFLRRFSAFVSRNTSRKTKRKFLKWQWGAAQTNTLFFVSFSKTSEFIPKSCRRKRVPQSNQWGDGGHKWFGHPSTISCGRKAARTRQPGNCRTKCWKNSCCVSFKAFTFFVISFVVKLGSSIQVYITVGVRGWTVWFPIRPAFFCLCC